MRILLEFHRAVTGRHERKSASRRPIKTGARRYTIDIYNELRNAKDLPGAIEASKKRLRLKPDEREAYNDVGLLLNDQKQFEKAQPLFKHAFRVIPAAAANPCFWLRYNAACSAALAAAEKDAEVKEPTEAERVQLRAKALAWLRQDLAAWASTSIVARRRTAPLSRPE